MVPLAEQGTSSRTPAQRNSSRKFRRSPGACSAPDPRLCDLLDASAGLTAQLVASQARWRAMTGFSVGYVAQWMKDGGPFGVVTRVVYSVATTSKSLAHVIIAHLEATLLEATAGMTRTEIYDRFWQITDELEHEFTAAEDRAVGALRKAGEAALPGLETADLRKAGIHFERVSLIRLARARRIDLFGERP